MASAFREITAEEISILMREWFDVYGEPPREIDWNPSMARRRKKYDVEERFRKDACWPYSYDVRRVFGTFQAAVIASGFYPRFHTDQWEELPLHARSRFLRGQIDIKGNPRSRKR